MTLPPFDVPYPQKAEVGYKWYDAENITPLFPFGFGLSYTSFAYSGLTATVQSVNFAVRNAGTRDGAEIAQVYAQVPGEAYKRLVGWSKVVLKTGEARTVTVAIDPLYLSVFDTARHSWKLQSGNYGIYVGGSSRNTSLEARIRVNG